MLVYLQMIDDPKDKSKFEQLYHRYRGLMFHVANKILNNTADAEDAVGEAFIAIAKNIQKISDIHAHKTRAYVVIIVERKAIDIYRAKQRRADAGFDEAYEGAVTPAPTDNTAAQAMARLPDKYRELLYLKHYCGYSSKEIAKMMGLSDDMVRRTLSDARKRLKEELEKEGIEV